MRRWFGRARNAPKSQVRPLLQLERLEDRNCPTAIQGGGFSTVPQVVGFSAVPMTGQEVLLSGIVQDDNAATAVVNFSGEVSDCVTPNADGQFSLLTSAAGLGTVSAQVSDPNGATSASVNTSIATPAPTITLSLDSIEGQTVTLSGLVGDMDPSSCQVTFSGAVSGLVSVEANGTFLLQTPISQLGAVDATATDAWGQTSNTAEVNPAGDAPSLTLNVMPDGDGTYTVSGQVVDQDPASCTVNLSGAITGSVATNSDGSFSLTASASILGVVNATVTDSQGLTSSQDAVDLTDDSTPTLTMNATLEDGQTVLITGQVSDNDAGDCSVNLSGVASGTIATNPDGSFNFTTTAWGLGAIYATATNPWGLTSAPVEADVSDPAPTITMEATQIQGQEVTLMGTVNANTVNNLWVTISGAASGGVQTDSTGTFQITVQAWTLGAIDATATDIWGQVSNTAEVDLSSNAPTVTLTATPEGGQTVLVTGQVSDRDPGTCSVSFSGEVCGTVTTDPNGTFQYTTTAAASGAITATATNVWGQNSNPAEADVTIAQGSGSDSTTTDSGGATTDSNQAPDLTMNLTLQGGTTVTLSGQVNDADPEDCTVTFSGVVNGTVTPNPNGTYSFTTTATGLGTISAIAVNAAQLSSNVVATPISVAAPTLTLNLTLDDARNVTLTGQVTGPDPSHDLVVFIGAVSGSVTPNADGSFSLQTEALALGNVQAVVRDSWDQVSAQATATVTNQAPEIVNFKAVPLDVDHAWHFQGTALDESPYHLKVFLEGTPSVNNVPITVSSTGGFATDIVLGPKEQGTVAAEVEDWWGTVSEAVFAEVWPC